MRIFYIAFETPEGLGKARIRSNSYPNAKRILAEKIKDATGCYQVNATYNAKLKLSIL